MGRHTCCLKQKLRKGLWSPEEDEKLLQHITKYGHGCWSSVPKLAGLQRCGKSCRLRWINYLRPDLKRGAFSQEEEDLIIQFHSELGNRWSQIAARLPGRTDNEIKNLWNSSIKKKLREKGIDPNTHKPLSHDKAAGTPNSIPSGQRAADREPEGAPTFRSSLRFPTDYDANPVFPFRHEPDSRPILPALPPSTSIISTSTTGLGTMATLLQVNTRACCASALSGSGYWESGTSSSGSGTTANSNSSSSSSSIELQATTPFLQSSAFPWRELAGNREPDQLHVEDELDELNWTEFLQSATMTSIPTPPTFHQSLDQSQTQIQNLKLNVKASTAQFALDELTNWQQLSRSSLLSPLAPLQQHQQQQNQIAQLKNSDTYSKDLQRISTAFGQV